MPLPLPLSQQNLTDAFAVLLEDAFRRTDRIEERLDTIERLYSSRIEHRSYQTFLEALRLATHGKREELRIRERRFTAAQEAPAHIRGRQSASIFENLTGAATSIGDQLEIHLPELSVPRADELEVFAVPFTRAAKAIVPNVELLFLPWFFDGYRAQLYDVAGAGDDRFQESLGRRFGDDIKFVKLWHPATRQEDIFQHAVFAHELGHVAIDLPAHHDAITRIEGVDRAPAVPWLYSTLAQSTQPLPRGLGGAHQRQLVRWFRELACDVFAMRLIGPAFAVAFVEVTAHNRMLEPEQHTHHSHPPAHLRFEVLEREANRFRFAEHDDVVRPLLRSYLASYPREAEADELIPGSRDFLLGAVERFRLTLPWLLGEQEYTVSRLGKDVALVFELAGNGVPPAERLVCVEEPPPGRRRLSADVWSSELDWRSILNGTLFWHLHRVAFPALSQDADTAQQRQRQRALAARLCVGAIELSEFQYRASYLRMQYRHMDLRRRFEVAR